MATRRERVSAWEMCFYMYTRNIQLSKNSSVAAGGSDLCALRGPGDRRAPRHCALRTLALLTCDGYRRPVRVPVWRAALCTLVWRRAAPLNGTRDPSLILSAEPTRANRIEIYPSSVSVSCGGCFAANSEIPPEAAGRRVSLGLSRLN